MMLRVRDIAKSIAGRPVLRAVNLECSDGDITCLFGGNGAGKSTLLKVVSSIIAPDAGRVWIEEEGGIVAKDRRRHIGYLPENPDPMPWVGVAEWLSLVASLRRANPPRRELIDALDLEPILRRRLEALSLGQRRRVHLAAALVGDPWLLVADEPTNGLDVQGVPALIHLLEQRRRNGQAALIATHDQSFATTVRGRCLRLDEGRIDACTPKDDP